jgi:hypothetical protein
MKSRTFPAYKMRYISFQITHSDTFIIPLQSFAITTNKSD